jgi:hypothetical protein
MQTRQALVHESIRNSLIALDRPAFDRREIAGLHAQLRKHARRLDALVQEQFRHHATRTSDGIQVASLRKDLRARLLRISSLATVTLRGLPGIEEDVRMPRANCKSADLVDATTRICRNLEPHLRTLSRAGLPNEAVTQVQALARKLDEKHANPDTAIARRSRATASIPDALNDAREIIGALDRTIRIELADDPASLHVWNRAKRIPRKLGRPKRK